MTGITGSLRKGIANRAHLLCSACFVNGLGASILVLVQSVWFTFNDILGTRWIPSAALDSGGVPSKPTLYKKVWMPFMLLLTSQLTRTPTIQRNQTSLLLNSHFSPFLKWGFSETVLPSLSLFLSGEVHTAAGCLCVDEPPLSFALSAAAPPNPPVLSWDSKSAAPSTPLSSTSHRHCHPLRRTSTSRTLSPGANFCGDDDDDDDKEEEETGARVGTQD